ncbi:MAG: four helix bundle protein [Candidatus Omnitrophota bacterium]
MEKTRSYTDLAIWNKGIELVKAVYRTTETFPRKEMFGLTNQMRRAAVSIPSNIAEGQARKHTKEFIQFLHQALGSMAELDTQTIIAFELDYIVLKEKEIITKWLMDIRKMTYGLLRSLNTRR